MNFDSINPEKISLFKWVIAAAGAVVSFYVIDMGKLKLEKFRVEAEKEQALLNSYLQATEAADPDLWLRKLRFIKKFSRDESISQWAKHEEKYIKERSALIALYKETLKIASILGNRRAFHTDDWAIASKRFHQLYWADLPFYGESQEVTKVMIHFKTELDKIENNTDPEKWKLMDNALITLSQALKIEYEKLQTEFTND